jgi:hypothetical protein
MLMGDRVIDLVAPLRRTKALTAIRRAACPL